MPWKETDAMKERRSFIEAMLKQDKPFCQLCREYGISEKTGQYLGTLSEGDLLWDIKKYANLTLRAAQERPLSAIRRRRDYESVSITSDIEDLLHMANSQNFVPVVDDLGSFIGIITRTQVMNYLITERRRGEVPGYTTSEDRGRSFRGVF